MKIFHHKRKDLNFGELVLYEGEFFKEWLYYEYLFSPNHFNGCIPITEEDGLFLVIDGKFRGTIWQDELVDGKGVTPVRNRNSQLIDFLEMMELWIEEYFNNLIDRCD